MPHQEDRLYSNLPENDQDQEEPSSQDNQNVESTSNLNWLKNLPWLIMNRVFRGLGLDFRHEIQDEHQKKLDNLTSMFPKMDKDFLHSIVKQYNGDEDLLELWVQEELVDLLGTDNTESGQSRSKVVTCLPIPIDRQFFISHQFCHHKPEHNAKVMERLSEEKNNLARQNSSNVGISAGPIDENIEFIWKAVIIGPEDSPFEGGIFHLILVFCQEYPSKPPHVRFISKMFHPNISSNGKLPILYYKESYYFEWVPEMSVVAMLKSIQTLLKYPKVHNLPEELLPNQLAVQLYKENGQKYKSNIQDLVKISLNEQKNYPCQANLTKILCSCLLEECNQCFYCDVWTIPNCSCITLLLAPHWYLYTQRKEDLKYENAALLASKRYIV